MQPCWRAWPKEGDGPDTEGSEPPRSAGARNARADNVFPRRSHERGGNPRPLVPSKGAPLRSPGTARDRKGPEGNANDVRPAPTHTPPLPPEPGEVSAEEASDASTRQHRSEAPHRGPRLRAKVTRWIGGGGEQLAEPGLGTSRTMYLHTPNLVSLSVCLSLLPRDSLLSRLERHQERSRDIGTPTRTWTPTSPKEKKTQVREQSVRTIVKREGEAKRKEERLCPSQCSLEALCPPPHAVDAPSAVKRSGRSIGIWAVVRDPKSVYGTNYLTLTPPPPVRLTVPKLPDQRARELDQVRSADATAMSCRYSRNEHSREPLP